MTGACCRGQDMRKEPMTLSYLLLWFMFSDGVFVISSVASLFANSEVNWGCFPKRSYTSLLAFAFPFFFLHVLLRACVCSSAVFLSFLASVAPFLLLPLLLSSSVYLSLLASPSLCSLRARTSFVNDRLSPSTSVACLSALADSDHRALNATASDCSSSPLTRRSGPESAVFSPPESNDASGPAPRRCWSVQRRQFVFLCRVLPRHVIGGVQLGSLAVALTVPIYGLLGLFSDDLGLCVLPSPHFFPRQLFRLVSAPPCCSPGDGLQRRHQLASVR
eukprot:1403494-Rhodomonas_salina.3